MHITWHGFLGISLKTQTDVIWMAVIECVSVNVQCDGLLSECILSNKTWWWHFLHNSRWYSKFHSNIFVLLVAQTHSGILEHKNIYQFLIFSLLLPCFMCAVRRLLSIVTFSPLKSLLARNVTWKCSDFLRLRLWTISSCTFGRVRK